MHSLPPFTSIRLFQKKSKLVVGCPYAYFSEKAPWTLQISHFTFRKQLFIPGNSTELCYILWKFQDQNPKPMENPHDFFLITRGKSTSFLLDQGVCPCSFFNTLRNSISSTPPIWIFSWSKILIKNMFG